MLYKGKSRPYCFYYRSHSNTWYIWNIYPEIPSPYWARLEPALHEIYVDEQLQISNELEFVIMTGCNFKRPYQKISDKWKAGSYAGNYADIWYTKGK